MYQDAHSLAHSLNVPNLKCNPFPSRNAALDLCGIKQKQKKGGKRKNPKICPVCDDSLEPCFLRGMLLCILCAFSLPCTCPILSTRNPLFQTGPDHIYHRISFGPFIAPI